VAVRIRMAKRPEELLADLKADPSEGTLHNVVSDLLESDDPVARKLAEDIDVELKRGRMTRRQVELRIAELITLLDKDPFGEFDFDGGRRRKSQTKRFGSCVKAVRKTVKARKGSTKESAAIAICTTTLLHPRGRTIKRYRKGRLLTQRR